jgi:phosphate-selective porin O/P
VTSQKETIARGGIFRIPDVPQARYLHGRPTQPRPAGPLPPLIGSRVMARTPVAGLSVGGSAFPGVAEESGVKNRNTVFGFQAEYLSDAWSVRAEYARDTEGRKYIINSGYVEVAYRITPQWQVAGRYDRFQNTLPEFSSPEFPALLKHRDWTAGVAYWFTPNLVLKAAYHDVMATGSPVPRWRTISRRQMRGPSIPARISWR